jgi:glycosyltransferase involved in cell wall biosynthesis
MVEADKKIAAGNAREPLSVCIVCRDEAENIRACLASVAWADEIIVVDSGSTDETVAIAREFTDKVVFNAWPGYIEQKNFALDHATHAWALCLNADERVSPELAAEIKQKLAAIKKGQTRCNGFEMPRRTFYLGRWINHGGWYPDKKVRFVRRDSARWAGTNPHDHMQVDGEVGALTGDIHHYTYRDIADHLVTINNFTTVAAKEMLAKGKGLPLLHMLFNPGLRFLRMYCLRLGFLDGMAGFVVASLASYYVFLKYAKLWELRLKR